MQGSCTKTAVTAAMLNTGSAEYYGARAVDGDKTENFFFAVSTIMWMSSRGTKCGPNFLTREDFQPVLLTVVDDILASGLASTATTVPIVNKSRKSPTVRSF